MNRRQVLREQVECIAELAERTLASPYDQELLEKRLARVRAAIEHKPPTKA